MPRNFKKKRKGNSKVSSERANKTLNKKPFTYILPVPPGPGMDPSVRLIAKRGERGERITSPQLLEKDPDLVILRNRRRRMVTRL